MSNILVFPIRPQTESPAPKPPVNALPRRNESDGNAPPPADRLGAFPNAIPRLF